MQYNYTVLKSIKAVAFDIDGTLYSDWSLYIRIVPYFLRHLSFFLKYNKVRHILHRTAPLPDFYEYQARLLADELGVTTEEAHHAIEERVYRGLVPYFERVRPHSHVYETFSRFKAAGLKLAILSDFPPSQKGGIWGVAALCDVVLGSEELGALKPSKYPFSLLAQRLDLEPGDILYVGNSIHSDIQGARNAGMRSAYIMPLWRVLLRRPPMQADIVFSNYRQLQRMVLA